jgi:hypothetical protein
MKVAAERPGDANATPEPPLGREPEGASFASARLPSRRERPPVFLLAFLVVLSGIVVIGVGGRTPAVPAVVPPLALVSPSGIAMAATLTSPSRLPGGPSFSPGSLPTPAPILTTGPGPIQLQARRHPETMFVAGDVFAEHVTWVFVSLQDQRGRVAGWASVSMPGAAGPGVGAGPTLRFAVELAVPADAVSATIWVLAGAYDTEGKLVASTRLEVGPDGAGASPGAMP